MPKKIFFSYSHKDEALRDKLGTHLKVMEHEKLVKFWYDRCIIAGSPVDDEIDVHLEKADIFLLLVSADFLASRYCYGKEMSRALELRKERKTHIIPVILRPCDWRNSKPFRNLLSVPRDGKAVTTWSNRDEAFLDITTSIREVVV